MRVRGIIGVVFCLIGALWIAQGVGAAKGSFMTGQPMWAVIGGVAAVVGVGLVLSARRSSAAPSDDGGPEETGDRTEQG